MIIKSRDIQLRRPTQPILVVALALLGVGNLVIPPSENLIMRSYLLVAVVAIAGTIVSQVPRLSKNFRFVPLMLVLAASYVPGFLGGQLNDYGIVKLFGVGIAIILLIAPTVFADPERSMAWLLILIGAIALAMCLALLLAGQEGNVGRTQIEGLNPIGTARVTAFLPVVALSVMAFYWSSVARWRMALFGVALLGAFLTIETGSRGPIISALVALIALLPVLYQARKMSGRTLGALCAFGITMALLLARFPISGLDRVLTVDSSGRDLLYSESLRVLANNPLGIGWGNLAEKIQFSGQAVEGRLYSHNVFLEIAVEGGWLALCATLAIVLVALVIAYKHAITGHACAPIVYAVLVFALVNAQFSNDIVGNRLLWLFLGLALALGALLNGHEARPERSIGERYPSVAKDPGPFLPVRNVTR